MFDVHTYLSIYPVGSIISTPVQTGLGAHPASYTMGIGSFLGGKRPERGVDHPPLSSAEVKKRVELYLYSPLWAFVACEMGEIDLYLYVIYNDTGWSQKSKNPVYFPL